MNSTDEFNIEGESSSPLTEIAENDGRLSKATLRKGSLDWCGSGVYPVSLAYLAHSIDGDYPYQYEQDNEDHLSNDWKIHK